MKRVSNLEVRCPIHGGIEGYTDRSIGQLQTHCPIEEDSTGAAEVCGRPLDLYRLAPKLPGGERLLGRAENYVTTPF